jgi:hypothetical protein
VHAGAHPGKKKRTMTKDAPTAASPTIVRDAETSTTSARSCETTTLREPRTLGACMIQSVGARVDWASLIRRVYLEDILACPCGGRRRVVADITEREVVVAILDQLGLPSCPPPIARARSPGREAA